ncbi:hypothetical protein L3Y34_010450 [Caenorhabditis briggsae]|uniref:Uncharacterized protein n=1 Tax=Caenorhabditis briggsae TaxID=6238 RepID=A0AAE8ZQ11_CAEBR|nr:hypothetical protein L3Y34_010450 [Caenorhabditis briggsae]
MGKIPFLVSYPCCPRCRLIHLSVSRDLLFSKISDFHFSFCVVVVTASTVLFRPFSLLTLSNLYSKTSLVFPAVQ